MNDRFVCRTTLTASTVPSSRMPEASSPKHGCGSGSSLCHRLQAMIHNSIDLPKAPATPKSAPVQGKMRAP